jgi:plasmid stabilization system protein ParE
MLDLFISSKAEADLIDIWLYIAEDQPINADRFLDKLNEAAKSLAGTSGMGVSRASLSEGVRCFPVGNYILFYRVKPTVLEIVRVLSASRDSDNFVW